MTTPSSIPVESEAVGDRLDPQGLSQAAGQPSLGERQAIDASCRVPVLLFYGSAVAWLLVGSLLGLLASLKMHWPGFLADYSWLTFGRVRPAHLNMVTFGWSSLVALGSAMWMVCRLCRVPLRFPGAVVAAGIIWNLGVLLGLLGDLGGESNSPCTLR
eukprot:TRINITY_DN17735_c0_g1_i1.p3 TRINITY_DN17735_c0_g1~~TRINITY_DN17735_c0_g1_i1.p3  ORF type:complete len:158 (+),score=28.33 TRINITY_DN17735_c0_g1_i1:309-782(+)